MTTTTAQRSTDRHTWVCDNCRCETRATRKRCADCGTSRF